MQLTRSSSTDNNTSFLYFLLWPWKGSKKARCVLVHLVNSGPHLNHDDMTSGNSCMETGFELSSSEECLQQRCQDRAGIPKPVLVVLSQYQKKATVVWDMGWTPCLSGERPWLVWVQYLNLDMCLHLQTCFSGELCLGKQTIQRIVNTICFSGRSSQWIKFQFQNIYLRFYFWFITNIPMVIVPPDLRQWLEACCSRHSISRRFYYLNIVFIFKSIYKTCLKPRGIITSSSLTLQRRVSALLFW